MKSNQITSARLVPIDILKIISIFSVLVIHISAVNIYYPLGSLNWYSTMAWATVSRFAVPVFFMCTGAIMLNPLKEISIKQIYTKYLPKMVICLFVWAFAYELFLVFMQGYTLAGVWLAFKNVILLKHHLQLYYLQITILIYIFLPVLRLFVKYADRKLQFYLLAAGFFFGSILPALAPFYPFSLLGSIIDCYKMHLPYAAMFFVCLAITLYQTLQSTFINVSAGILHRLRLYFFVFAICHFRRAR